MSVVGSEMETSLGSEESVASSVFPPGQETAAAFVELSLDLPVGRTSHSCPLSVNPKAVLLSRGKDLKVDK